MDFGMRGDAVGVVASLGCGVRMIEIWIVINVIVAALAGRRAIRAYRSERDVRRACDETKLQDGAVIGPWTKGQGS